MEKTKKELEKMTIKELKKEGYKELTKKELEEGEKTKKRKELREEEKKTRGEIDKILIKYKVSQKNFDKLNELIPKLSNIWNAL